jgi:ketosteroid isomerase-like protein
MKKALFASFLLLSIGLNAQTTADYLKEINRDIWLPFIEAYGTFNAGQYKSLQTEDFIRVAANNKNLPNPNDYFNSTEKWFADMKQKELKLTIAFRFTERIANDKVASERGVFELKAFDANGKELWKDYGKFHVFMRKLNGVWKIVVDYDSNEKETVNLPMYVSAFAMDDFEKY